MAGHKLYMDSFLSFPELVNNLTKQKINWWAKYGGHAKGLKMQESATEMVGHLSKDQGRLDCNTPDGQDRHQLANIHDLPQERNFCDEQATG
jgi:hypothetical protein